MSDYPERISISPVHRQKRDDDFYLVDRKALPGKGVEYVRADMVTDFETHPAGTGKRIEELEAKLDWVKASFRRNMMQAYPNYTHERFDRDFDEMLKGQDDE